MTKVTTPARLLIVVTLVILSLFATSPSSLYITIIPAVAAFSSVTPSSTRRTLTIKLTSTVDDTIDSTMAPAAPSSSSLGGINLRDIVLDAARARTNSPENDESSLDLSGIVWLEHINLVVTSNEIAEHFYIDFLGCTRDEGKSFHVNLGQQQFHLAETKPGIPPQKINGSIGLVVPSLDTLRARIPKAMEVCQNTKFAILNDDVDNKVITISCPDGNIFHIYATQDDVTKSTKDTPRKMENLHAEGGSYGPQRMAIRSDNPGIRYIEFACPVNSTPAIARFYKDMLHCNVQTKATATESPTVVVSVGSGVDLVFVERPNISQEDIDAMEGVHICVYVNGFQQLYEILSKHDLIWTNPRFVHLDTCDTWEEAFNSRTLRFKHIIDVGTEGNSNNNRILELEHETRPLRHGQYLKVPKYEPK